MALRASPPPYGKDEPALRQLGQRGGKVVVTDVDGNEVLAGWVKRVLKEKDINTGEGFIVTVVADWDHQLRRADR